jgi:hypothetical protein
MKGSVAILPVLILSAHVTYASDLEDLAEDGYAVIEKTQVDGEFEGCDFEKRVPLTNGLIFVCSEYSYSYAFMPDVLILKNVRGGDIKVIIDDEEYDGTLYRR